MKRGTLWAILLSLVGLGGVWSADAVTFNSSSYSINGSVGGSTGGSQSSTDYVMVSTAGESVAGQTSSASYKLGQGYAATLDQSFELTLDSALVAFGNVTPGTPVAKDATITVSTDAVGYGIAAQQNGNMQSGSNTIPGVVSTIASPASWSNGATKGLGFTLVSSSATALDSKWASGSAFAALPASTTTVYTRSGLSGGVSDTLGVRYKLDIAASQPTGSYTNQVTWTGTITP